MDPQQEIFTAILMALRASPYDVYDGHLPPKGTSYPFIYVANNQLIESINKGAVFGNVVQHIDIYTNDPKNRGTTSVMALAVKNLCRHIEHTNNFSWDLVDTVQRSLPDNTTDEPLLHVSLDLTFTFS